jgi:hypothetical protein
MESAHRYNKNHGRECRHEKIALRVRTASAGRRIHPGIAPRGGGAETQTARTAQAALEARTPKLAVTEEILPLRIPGHTIGEASAATRPDTCSSIRAPAGAARRAAARRRGCSSSTRTTNM